MKKRFSTSLFVALSIVCSLAIVCSTLFLGIAGAQLYPQQYGVGGYSDNYGVNYGGNYGGYNVGNIGVSYGQPATYAGGYGDNYGMNYGGNPVGYNVGNSGVSYGQPQPATYAGGSAGQAGSMSIAGFEGLQGFSSGQNRLSLAVIPVSQQNNMMGFQMIGFAISNPDTGSAAVYSLNTPLAGIINPSQNTLQIDLSNIDSAIKEAGFIDSSKVYDIIRTDPKVVVIDVDMNYQKVQDSQTIFSVNGVSIVSPDGKMQAFSMQQPTQLVFDSQSLRMYMVAFPQMVDAFNNYYGASYSQVLPVVYSQPIPILAPIFVPYFTPYPIFFGFVGFDPFFFGSGFVSFFNFNSFNGRFPIHDRNFGHNEFNEFRKGNVGNNFKPGEGIGKGNVGNNFKPGEGIGKGNVGNNFKPGEGIGKGNVGNNFKPGEGMGGIGQGNRISTPNFQPGNIGSGNIGNGNIRAPSGAGMGNGIGSGVGGGFGGDRGSIRTGGGIGGGLGGRR